MTAQIHATDIDAVHAQARAGHNACISIEDPESIASHANNARQLLVFLTTGITEAVFHGGSVDDLAGLLESIDARLAAIVELERTAHAPPGPCMHTGDRGNACTSLEDPDQVEMEVLIDQVPAWLKACETEPLIEGEGELARQFRLLHQYALGPIENSKSVGAEKQADGDSHRQIGSCDRTPGGSRSQSKRGAE